MKRDPQNWNWKMIIISFYSFFFLLTSSSHALLKHLKSQTTPQNWNDTKKNKSTVLYAQNFYAFDSHTDKQFCCFFFGWQLHLASVVVCSIVIMYAMQMSTTYIFSSSFISVELKSKRMIFQFHFYIEHTGNTPITNVKCIFISHFRRVHHLFITRKLYFQNWP